MAFSYEEEIRDEYLVDKKHKHIWAIEIRLLQEVARICEKYNLSYFVYGGTLLGTIRHKGFIPWDDDMDIAMLRKDYEIFMEKAKEELNTSNYHLQVSEQFGEVYEGFARLRDNNSTAIIRKDSKRNCNHGIFIDIFPLDNLVEDDKKRKAQFRKIKLLSALIFYRVNQDNELGHPLIKSMINIIRNEKFWNWLVNRLKYECTKYNEIRCEKVGILSCDPFDEKCYWYIEDIDKTVDMPFEDILVKVPVGYDRCLRIGYDNYMEFPPVEERGKWHENIYFDPFTPFGKYEDMEKCFSNFIENSTGRLS